MKYVWRYGVILETEEGREGGEDIVMRVAMELLEEEEGEEEETEESTTPSTLYVSRAHALIQDNPRHFHPPSKSLALYPESFNSTLKQCCTKKFFKVTVDKNGSGMKVRDMVNNGDVNWIREQEGREEGLKRLGLSQQTCGCSLCRRERGEIVEMEDLHILLKYFQDDENIEDAIDVCGEILRRDGKHVEGLLERARVTGWSDENGEGFVERERLIREAVEITEGKEVRVNEAMRECESYYRDDVFKRVVSGSGGNSGNSLVKSERVCEGVWVYENLLSPLGCVEAVKAAEVRKKRTI